MRKFYFLSREKEQTSKVRRRDSPKTADGFTKTFPNWPRTFMEGMEPRLLCDVTVVLDIAAFLRYCRVVLGEGFGSKYKP